MTGDADSVFSGSFRDVESIRLAAARGLESPQSHSARGDDDTSVGGVGSIVTDVSSDRDSGVDLDAGSVSSSHTDGCQLTWKPEREVVTPGRGPVRAGGKKTRTQLPVINNVRQ